MRKSVQSILLRICSPSLLLCRVAKEYCIRSSLADVSFALRIVYENTHNTTHIRYFRTSHSARAVCITTIIHGHMNIIFSPNPHTKKCDPSRPSLWPYRLSVSHHRYSETPRGLTDRASFMINKLKGLFWTIFRLSSSCVQATTTTTTKTFKDN